LRFLPSLAGYSALKARQFYETLARKATEITGVKSAALTSGLPLTSDREYQHVIPEGYQFPSAGESAEVLTYVVDDNYFDTFGVPLLAGRGFRATDREEAPPVAVVNEAFAKQYLGPSPVGKKLRLRDRKGPPLEVVGVTMTGKTLVLLEPPVQVVYLPVSQNPSYTMTLIAETTGDPAALAGPLEKLARSLDPNISITRVRTMDDLFERSAVANIRTVYQIYDCAALLGLLLAVVGLYAVVSYQVGWRTREIGIRMALGADRLGVIKIFVRQAAIMGVAGIAAGGALSLYINRVSTSPFGFANLDPLLLAAVSLALLLTAIAASLIPARRAARIDPQQALRQE
jgi:predicted permease